MPGIEELLPRLAGEGVLLGIVTGNIESAAHIKLARGDLNRYFAFGGYGSDSRDRTELTKRALERGGEVSGSPLDPATTIGGRRHPARRQGLPRRRDQSRRRRHRQLHGRGTADAGADWSIEDVTEGFPA